MAVAMMPVPQVWAVCFFIMIILLGLDTQFLSMEVVITSITDLFSEVLRRAGRRECFVLLFCLTCFFSQLVMITEGGMYIFQMFDYYACNGACILFLCVCESLAVGWIFVLALIAIMNGFTSVIVAPKWADYDELLYILLHEGADRLSGIITNMTGKRPNPFFKICWRYLTPLVSLSSFTCSLIQYRPLTFNRWYVYPTWAYVMGWMMALSSILLVPGWALYKLTTITGTLSQRLHSLCWPDPPDCTLALKRETAPHHITEEDLN